MVPQIFMSLHDEGRGTGGKGQAQGGKGQEQGGRGRHRGEGTGTGERGRRIEFSNLRLNN